MKKIICFVLSFVLLLSFSGCVQNASDTDNNDDVEIIEVCEHIYSEATCTNPAKCTKCGEIKGSATGHSFSNSTCTVGGTCSKCGEKSNALGHLMSAATCTSPQKCSRCGTTSGKALGHYDNGSGKCSRCGTTLSIDMQKRVGSPNDCSRINNLGGFSFYKNTADGIKVLWGGKNNSGKTINYYTVTFHFYNAVGDEAYSEITGKATKNVKMVGPVAPGEDLIVFSVVDYVPVCSKVQIDEIKLEYSDGTVEYGWYGWYTTNINSFLK